jgi:hypothetical protein
MTTPQKAKLVTERRRARRKRLKIRLFEIAQANPEANPHQLLADEENCSIWTIYKALSAR